MPTRRLFLHCAALLGAVAFVACATHAQTAAPARTDAPLDFWDIVQSRRSVRAFKPDAPVPAEHVTKILDAARMSATSGNQQPWKFLVVRSPEKIRELKEACLAAAAEHFAQHPEYYPNVTKEQFTKSAQATYDGYLSAPVYVVVLTDNRSKYPDYNHYDGPLAAANLMLAARALGYGTVFLTDSIPDSVTKAVFKIPDYYTRVCITPIGVPVEWPQPPKKKPLEDFVAYESF
ncbi:nitroreductase family protein [Opitutus terrae]|uniref:Nitroreductase n=1 Tax=Opitutus terrae (strain DSM 11246 / JCM 15787 / PB90-1) TaxID=452637 RepID=B1ZXV3_OPITP|nr:nitroreductase family protein [Opitutus terrae]ACB75155.1 nitroreductase [Opitutus terrae PB90-1]